MTVPSRTSDGVLSVRPSYSVPQSHSVTTTLRSAPRGRGGVCAGASPAAMRSVQSANIVRCSPSRRNMPFIAEPIGPIATRSSHASTWESTAFRIDSGIARVASLPIWWQLRQPVTALPSSCCDSSPSGSSIIESHQAAG